MNPSGPERRKGSYGRRLQDGCPPDHCLDHGEFKAKIEALQSITADHKITLEKLMARTNITLGSVILSLVVLIFNLLIEIAKVKGG